MADIKQKYGTNGQALTCTIASLANNSARQSTEVDNSSNVFIDALVVLKITAGASGTSSTGYVNLYAYATVDNGTTRTEGAGASDAAITLVSPTNLILVATVNVVANNVVYVGGPWSVARAFGGSLPEKWGMVVENKSGGTLAASGQSLTYQGVYLQTV